MTERVWTAYLRGRPVGTKGTFWHAMEERDAWLKDGEPNTALAYRSIPEWSPLSQEEIVLTEQQAREEKWPW